MCKLQELLFLLQILFFQITKQFTLHSCCKFQNSFVGGNCLTAEKQNYQNDNLQPFPKKFKWLSVPYSNKTFIATGTKDIEFRLTSSSEFAFKFLYGTPTQFLVSKSANGQGNLFSDGYVEIENGTVILPPTEYCINSISADEERLQIYAFDHGPMLPKCCPWFYATRWLHPDLCYQSQYSNKISSNLIPKKKFTKYITFYRHSISSKCIKQNQMVATMSTNIFNTTKLEILLNSLQPGSFCFDDVITSHDLKFEWSRDQALFYCGEEWPNNEFGLTNTEKVLYGISIGASTIFLLIAISIYYIKLQRTHCQVHTWIEFFYMISLFLFGCFCVLQIYFPENQENFCTIYHFVAVSGYIVFGIALFSWATILSVDLFIAFKELMPLLGFNSGKDIQRFCIYCWIGFTFPILVAVSTFVYSYINWGDAGFCIPIQFATIRAIQGILLVINLLFFLATVILILKHKRNTQFATGRNGPKQLNQLISCFLKLFLISGITYGGVIFGFIYGTERDSSWYLILFRMFLNLRGVTVFFIYVWNKQIKNLLTQFFSKEGVLCECFLCKGKGDTLHNSNRNRLLQNHSTLKRTEIMSV